jgi:hypothetical protein
LKTQLAATGRQKERVYSRMGPNAKSTCAQRVIDAIKRAGFADIALLPRTARRLTNPARGSRLDLSRQN